VEITVPLLPPVPGKTGPGVTNIVIEGIGMRKNLLF